jgi:hypothetical protein
LTVALVGEPLRLKSDPFPLSPTVCGLLCAPSVTVRVPVRVPVAVGVKVIVMLQLEAAASDPRQLLVCAKSPVIWMLVTLSDALPLFVSVAVCVALATPTGDPANVKLGGVSVALAPEPAPLKVMGWGDPAASSLIVIDPLRAPVPVGVKVTEIVQLPVAGTLFAQLSLSAKSPLATIEVIDKDELPKSRSRIVCGWLVEPTGRLPNCSDVVLRATDGAEAVPILTTNASVFPPNTLWNAPGVAGMSAELVAPAT